MPYPRLVRLRQNFPRPRVDNIPAAVRAALDALRADADAGETRSRSTDFDA